MYRLKVMKKAFEKCFSISELEGFVQEVVETYYPYAKLLHDHRKERTESSKQLVFPLTPTVLDKGN